MVYAVEREIIAAGRRPELILSPADLPIRGSS